MSRPNRWRSAAYAHMLFRFVKLMTYAQRPKRHPIRATKYVYDEMENIAHHAEREREGQGQREGEMEGRDWGEREDRRNLCAGIRISLCRQSAVLVVGLCVLGWHCERYALHTVVRKYMLRAWKDERIDKQQKRRAPKRTTDILAFTNEMLLVQMGFKP